MCTQNTYTFTQEKTLLLAGILSCEIFVQGWIQSKHELVCNVSLCECIHSLVCRGKDEDHHKGLQLCSERNALTFVVTRPSFLCPETWRRLFSSASTPIARDHYPLTDLTLFRSKAYNKIKSMLVKWYDGSGDADVVSRLRFYIVSFSASVIIKHSKK